MTPSELDAAVVQARLRLMRDLLADLESIGSVTAADLHRDRILRHAVERILGQLVELAASINSHIAATTLDQAPADYRSSFDAAESVGVVPTELCQRLRRSVGLRNVLAHEYVRIDLGLVADAVPAAAQDYGDYVRLLARWLQRRTS